MGSHGSYLYGSSIHNICEVPAGDPGAAYNMCAGDCSVAPKADAGSGAGWNGSDELVIRGPMLQAAARHGQLSGLRVKRYCPAKL
jgi:hypothetical protein